jgi:hypothetical protein
LGDVSLLVAENFELDIVVEGDLIAYKEVVMVLLAEMDLVVVLTVVLLLVVRLWYCLMMILRLKETRHWKLWWR